MELYDPEKEPNVSQPLCFQVVQTSHSYKHYISVKP